MSLWEQRYHPLRDEWVVVAAHRQNRPWIGETVTHRPAPLPSYVADCTFCPGNARVSGALNAAYEDVYVFDNDAPCVGPNAPEPEPPPSPVFQNRPARGLARVVCYSPRHDLTLAELSLDEVTRLVEVWQEQYRDLGSRDGIDHVLIFENKGAVVGVSNPHPHGQIYATNFVFRYIETEVQATHRHFEKTGRALLQDILEAEIRDGRRIVYENAGAVAFVPYFARYAYEVYVAPRATVASVAELSPSEARDFAEALSQVVIRYDNLWSRPFPYVMALHQAPTDGGDYRAFHFHAEFHPPLRKPDLLKYLAGPEIGGGNFLSDTTPEEKAAELRALPAVHYTRR